MAPVLYNIDGSPPCRAVQMLAKAIDLTLDVKDINVIEGEHLQPAFLKINPQHTVPTIDDDGYILWDSQAINAYLVNAYAKDDNLYPKNIKKRAIVNQKLHFNSSVFSTLFHIATPLRLGRRTTIPDDLKAEVREAYECLEVFLKENEWICGNSVTIADINIVANISSIQLFEPLTDEYPNTNKWLSNCKKQPWYEANVKGLNDFNVFYTSLMNG